MVSPGCRGDSDTSATSRDLVRTPVRGVYCSGSMVTTHVVGGSSIRDEVRSYEGVSKGGDMIK